MKLIVGLGNPGPKYETTRHNVGFLAIDHIVESWGLGPSKLAQKSEVYEAEKFSQKIIILKPMTYMNKSGESVGYFANFFKLDPSDIIVIHDEIDLMPMHIRFKTGGGTAGHNGLRSIDAAIGKEKNGYHRIRIGVGRPPGTQAVEDYVLGQFTDPELEALPEVFELVLKSVEMLLQGKVPNQNIKN
jgi:peptidyl-tRNA hydrolase, PTH1 family